MTACEPEAVRIGVVRDGVLGNALLGTLLGGKPLPDMLDIDPTDRRDDIESAPLGGFLIFGAF